jgi:hypothetical protein
MDSPLHSFLCMDFLHHISSPTLAGNSLPSTLDWLSHSSPNGSHMMSNVSARKPPPLSSLLLPQGTGLC